MDVSRRWMRITAAEINIMQVLVRRVVLMGSVESGYFDFLVILLYI